MCEKSIYEDNLLWDNFLSGSEDAYAQIYEKYSEKLFIQGLQFTSDRELIEDCVHDVFVKIYKNRSNLKPLSNLKVYLFVSLRNRIATTLKKQNMWIEPLDESKYSHLSDSNNIEDDLIDKENETNAKMRMDKLLNLLSIRQREAIHYRFYENMSTDEICVLMDMNYQSVQNLIQRSLKKIDFFLKKNRKK